MTRYSRVIFTDASVRDGVSGIAVVSDGFAFSERFPGADVIAAELRAVVAALRLFPSGPLLIVCDNSSVRNGAARLARNRGRGYGGPNCGALWAEWERLKGGRRIRLIAPKHRNAGLHGRAHYLARAAAKPEDITSASDEPAPRPGRGRPRD